MLVHSHVRVLPLLRSDGRRRAGAILKAAKGMSTGKRAGCVCEAVRGWYLRKSRNDVFSPFHYIRQIPEHTTPLTPSPHYYSLTHRPHLPFQTYPQVQARATTAPTTATGRATFAAPPAALTSGSRLQVVTSSIKCFSLFALVNHRNHGTTTHLIR